MSEPLDDLKALAVRLVQCVDALTTAPPPDAPLLTLDQAAERLAVGRSTMQEIVDRGEVPVVEVTGRAVRVDPRDLEVLIKARRSRRGRQ